MYMICSYEDYILNHLLNHLMNKSYILEWFSKVLFLNIFKIFYLSCHHENLIFIPNNYEPLKHKTFRILVLTLQSKMKTYEILIIPILTYNDKKYVNKMQRERHLPGYCQ